MIIVFDTETTGIPKHPGAKIEAQPKCIELAAVAVDFDGEIVDQYVQLFDPGQPLEPIITKITGITDEVLKDQPRFADKLPEIRKFFDRAAACVAHNLPFDTTIIELEVERAGGKPFIWPPIQICTVQENAERWGRRPKLVELYEEVMGRPLAQTHRALDDVEALIDVCKATGVLNAIASTAAA